MSIEATTIRAVRSSTVANAISYTSDLRVAQKKKSEGLRFGENEDQAIDLPCSIYHRGYVAWRWLRTAIEKCAGATLCRNHLFCCAVADTPFTNSVRTNGNSILPRSSKPLHCLTPPLVPLHCPLDGYYYRFLYLLTL
ncbi:hypothetical protein TNCV_2915651 [Trichonephila clavipes]|nr:hypothetical protein TNCV_2915651 [Trichonephila clavipes]